MVNKMEWSRDLTLALIEQYETYPCLYDTKHKFYSNKHARTDKLQKITDELKNIDGRVTVDDVKKKLTSLRQSFSHENTKMHDSQKSGAGTEEMYEPSVWWYEKLLFLIPHVKTRKTKSSLDLLTQVIDDDEEEALDIDSATMDSSSTERSVTESIPPQSSRGKRKRQEVEISDPIMTKTVSMLDILGSKLTASSTVETSKSDVEVFADYVARELRAIDDEDVLTDAKHEINKILYDSKKKWLTIKKQNETATILYVDHPPNAINLNK
ncbi:unnamed protein product [Brassicogethes aeneus]|uniref:MADF domain-containing protein n=1 Tax=Brassicogethes aeneus TaxID=1431903 RepID=A0A9P0B209_BRAAE|nr:unnamed protein product [Brassicogethes aeneus]